MVAARRPGARIFALPALAAVCCGRRWRPTAESALERSAFPVGRLLPVAPLLSAREALGPSKAGVTLSALPRHSGPGAGPRRARSNPETLVVLPALDTKGGQTMVNLPQTWQPFDLRIIKQGHWGSVIIGKTALVNEPVAIKVRDAMWWEATMQPEVFMLRALALADSGNVVQYLGSRCVSSRCFLMTVAADNTMEEEIKRWREVGMTQMPLKLSLPMLIDLLRGVRDMDQEGIVHGDLTEETVLMKDGRPLIGGFSSASILDTESKHGGPRFVSTIATHRIPPETDRGWPSGPSNNIWQVGAIFAEMRLGHSPMLEALKRLVPHFEDDPLDHVVEDRVLSVLRERFSVLRDPVAATLEADSQELLAGLLATRPEERWDSATALARAIAIAERRGIEVPPERQGPKGRAQSATAP